MTLLIYLQLGFVALYIRTRPRDLDRVQYYLFLGSEVGLLYVMINFFLMTDLIPDPLERLRIGNVLIAKIAIYALILVVALLYDNYL